MLFEEVSGKPSFSEALLNERRDLRLLGVMLAVLGGVAADPGVGGVITSAWINDAGGNWTDDANWDSAAFRNNDLVDYEVIVDLVTGSPFIVALDSDVSVNNFTLASDDATLIHTTGVFPW